MIQDESRKITILLQKQPQHLVEVRMHIAKSGITGTFCYKTDPNPFFDKNLPPLGLHMPFSQRFTSRIQEIQNDSSSRAQ